MMPGPSDYNPNGTIKHMVVMRPVSDLRKLSPVPIIIEDKSFNKELLPKFDLMPGPDRYPYEKFVKSISTNVGVRFPRADRNLRADFDTLPI